MSKSVSKPNRYHLRISFDVEIVQDPLSQTVLRDTPELADFQQLLAEHPDLARQIMANSALFELEQYMTRMNHDGDHPGWLLFEPFYALIAAGLRLPAEKSAWLMYSLVTSQYVEYLHPLENQYRIERLAPAVIIDTNQDRQIPWNEAYSSDGILFADPQSQFVLVNLFGQPALVISLRTEGANEPTLRRIAGDLPADPEPVRLVAILATPDGHLPDDEREALHTRVQSVFPRLPVDVQVVREMELLFSSR